MIVTIGLAGGLIAQTPLAMLIQDYGWRDATLINGAFGIVILLFTLWLVHDNPHGELTVTSNSTKPPLSAMTSIRRVLKNPQNWFAGLFTCFLNIPFFVLGGLWGAAYLQDVHHLTKLQASFVSELLFIGAILGSPFFGGLSDYMGRRKLPVIVAAAISLIVMLWILYVPHISMIELSILFFALGFFTFAQVIGYPIISENNPPALNSTAMGFGSVLIMSGGLISNPLSGWLMDYGKHHVIGQAMVYTSDDYLRNLLMLPIAIALALFYTFLLKETRCQPHAPTTVSTEAIPDAQ